MNFKLNDFRGQRPSEAARLGVKYDAGHAFGLTATSAPTLQVGTGDVAGWHRRRARPDRCVTAVPKLGDNPA